MFEKFGEFDSVEELNRAAAAQKEEGDEEALILLARENGIDKEDAEDYMDGCTEELATALMAAVGKLKAEKEDLKLDRILRDWTEEIEAECLDSEQMARAVRKKGKGLDGYIAILASDGFKNRVAVDKRIVRLCDKEIRDIVGEHTFSIGIPDKSTRKRLMRQYYLGGTHDRV